MGARPIAVLTCMCVTTDCASEIARPQPLMERVGMCSQHERMESLQCEGDRTSVFWGRAPWKCMVAKSTDAEVCERDTLRL